MGHNYLPLSLSLNFDLPDLPSLSILDEEVEWGLRGEVWVGGWMDDRAGLFFRCGAIATVRGTVIVRLAPWDFGCYFQTSTFSPTQMALIITITMSNLIHVL